MSQWLILAASAGGVAFMVTIAALLGFRERARLDAGALSALAAHENARVEASVVDAGGMAALGRLSDGKWLVARVMADGVGARVFAPTSVRVAAKGSSLTLAFDDIGYPALRLKLAEAPPRWLMEQAP